MNLVQMWNTYKSATLPTRMLTFKKYYSLSLNIYLEFSWIDCGLTYDTSLTSQLAIKIMYVTYLRNDNKLIYYLPLKILFRCLGFLGPWLAARLWEFTLCWKAATDCLKGAARLMSILWIGGSCPDKIKRGQ